MMSDKLREAAQAALAVVRMAQRSHREILLTYPPIDPLVHHRVYLRLEDAIKAVEDALAEAIKDSLTVAEQKPVGQMQESAYGRGQVLWFNKPADTSMLYAAPPRREWVSLTDEEIQAIHDTYYRRMGRMEFARAIEAKLKDKNGG